jgi:transcriptional regulator with XRE-family HTH domain
VADAVSVSRAHIWELETGNSKNPSLELLKNLASHFKVSVATLVGEEVTDSDEADMVMFRELKALTPEDQKLIADLIETIKKRKGGNKGGEKD